MRGEGKLQKREINICTGGFDFAAPVAFRRQSDHLVTVSKEGPPKILQSFTMQTVGLLLVRQSAL